MATLAKKYLIKTDHGEMGKNEFVCYYDASVSYEEIENGIILADHLDMYTKSVKSTFQGLVNVEKELGEDFMQMDFEYVTHDEYVAHMNDEYADVCPGVGVTAVPYMN